MSKNTKNQVFLAYLKKHDFWGLRDPPKGTPKRVPFWTPSLPPTGRGLRGGPRGGSQRSGVQYFAKKMSKSCGGVHKNTKSVKNVTFLGVLDPPFWRFTRFYSLRTPKVTKTSKKCQKSHFFSVFWGPQPPSLGGRRYPLGGVPFGGTPGSHIIYIAMCSSENTFFSENEWKQSFKRECFAGNVSFRITFKSKKITVAISVAFPRVHCAWKEKKGGTTYNPTMLCIERNSRRGSVATSYKPI